MKAKPEKGLCHELISASAGTGKTFQLVGRFLRLAYQGVPLDQILAVTFTRKAAGEILQRVLLELAEAHGNDKQRGELAARLGIDVLSQAECAALLQRLVHDLHRLRIGTLDSFFAQLGRCFALELELSPHWEIADESDDAALRVEAVERLLAHDDTNDVVRLMHLLTKGETNRSVATLVQDTVNKLYNIYLETAREHWTHDLGLKRLDEENIAAALELLRSYPECSKSIRNAINEHIASIEARDWQKFISKGLAAKIVAGEDDFFRKPIPKDLVDPIRTLIQHARTAILAPILARTEGTWQLLDRFHAHFVALKRERQCVRFEDITRALAQRGAQQSVEALSFRLDARLHHLLLDEFQDTSLSQWSVMLPFARQLTSSPAGNRSFFCVGDAKQAIYGWRGGIAQLLGNLPQQISHLEVRPLNTSFRSAPPVIEMVNHICQGLTQHPHLERLQPFVASWQAGFEIHSTARTHFQGYATLRTFPDPTENESFDEASFAFTANYVRELRKQSPDAEIAVIVRRNVTVGRMVFLLRQCGLDASEEAGNFLTDSAAVQLVLSLLTLIDHPGNTHALFHLQHSPLAELLGLRDPMPEAAVCEFAAFWRSRLHAEGYSRVLEGLATALASACSEREARRLSQLVQLAYDFEARATNRTSDFRTYVLAQRVSDPTAATIRVMNVHQSKGLQFDIVVLPELGGKSIEGQTPEAVVGRPGPTEAINSVWRYANQDVRALLPEKVCQVFASYEEARVGEAMCVLYVALTRAVHALHILIAPSESKEKHCPKSLAGLVRCGLVGPGPVMANQVLFECGDANWHNHPGRSLTGGRLVRSGRGDIAHKVEFAPAASAAQRGLESTAPSRLEGGGRVSLARLWDRKQRSGMKFGTLIHAFFSGISWLDGKPLDERKLLRLAIEAGASMQEAKAAWPVFEEMLKRTEVSRLLRQETYAMPGEFPWPKGVSTRLALESLRAEAHAEVKFAAPIANGLLEGSIDRLVLLSQGEEIVAADIVDFKTDSIPEGDAKALAEKARYYAPQLNAYRRAVSQMFHLSSEATAARLLFVSAGAVQAIDPA